MISSVCLAYIQLCRDSAFNCKCGPPLLQWGWSILITLSRAFWDQVATNTKCSFVERMSHICALLRWNVYWQIMNHTAIAREKTNSDVWYVKSSWTAQVQEFVYFRRLSVITTFDFNCVEEERACQELSAYKYLFLAAMAGAQRVIPWHHMDANSAHSWSKSRRSATSVPRGSSCGWRSQQTSAQEQSVLLERWY